MEIVFRNREEAAQGLAKALAPYRGKNPLVLAIPRGAVPMAKTIAEALGGEADVILVRKLRAPDQPELAIGAIDETGHVYLHPYCQQLDITDEYLEREKRQQLAVLRERRQQYTPARPPVSPKGRIVIVVDDGIATGSTMISALQALRAKGPAKLVVATGVAPRDTIRRIEQEADQVVCLGVPEFFHAVGQFYEDFAQVSDEEVMALLQAEGKRKRP
ncbi:MAG: phosphoribosyltransferase [bacterium]